MKISRGVFNTDQVNRDKMVFPAAELMRAEQRHQRECLTEGIPAGTPSCIQHDMHRLNGWSRPLGLYLDSQMVRVLGQIEEPESDTERSSLRAQADVHWSRFHKSAVSFKSEILQRAAIADSSSVRALQIEAAVVERAGIAADLYPDLFTPGAGNVDKDGLADYRHLINHMKEVQPGIFHDEDRDLLLFAHRFFRRSLSNRNKLNQDFLQAFAETTAANANLLAKLRLDPDIIGHPGSLRHLVELEYWHGPKYNDDIPKIPDGVAEHKADDRTRNFEGVDRTQIWWKSPETRMSDAAQPLEYRTFEIEELIENPSGGLGDTEFGCRYAHAEFSEAEDAITHFDGAIRAYHGDAYLNRIEAPINRAGKHAAYTKLFRFDGALPVQSWKELLTCFFRGNKLVPEYFGAEVDRDSSEKQDVTSSDSQKTAPTPPELAALIALKPGTIDGSKIRLCLERHILIGDLQVPVLEVGTGQVAEHLRNCNDLSDVTTMGVRDGILNLCRIAFASDDNLKTTFDGFIDALVDALDADVQTGLIQYAAIPLVWEEDGILVSLTIAGQAAKVARILKTLHTIVDPRRSPSEWIQPLSDLIKATVPNHPSSILWHGVDRGVLEIGRCEDAELQMSLPTDLNEQLREAGILS